MIPPYFCGHRSSFFGKGIIQPSAQLCMTSPLYVALLSFNVEYPESSKSPKECYQVPLFSYFCYVFFSFFFFFERFFKFCICNVSRFNMKKMFNNLLHLNILNVIISQEILKVVIYTDFQSRLLTFNLDFLLIFSQ